MSHPRTTAAKSSFSFNARILHLRNGLWEEDGVVDITPELVAAQHGTL
jgi:hypothetical protein